MAAFQKSKKLFSNAIKVIPGGIIDRTINAIREVKPPKYDSTNEIKREAQKHLKGNFHALGSSLFRLGQLSLMLGLGAIK